MGALNRSTLAARAILERNASEPMDEAVEMAKAGSPIALKLCLERLVPVPQDRAITLPLPTNKSQPGEVFATHSAVLRAVAQGRITPEEGHRVSMIVESRRRSWESIELDERMTELESRVAETKKRQPCRNGTSKGFIPMRFRSWFSRMQRAIPDRPTDLIVRWVDGDSAPVWKIHFDDNASPSVEDGNEDQTASQELLPGRDNAGPPGVAHLPLSEPRE